MIAINSVQIAYPSGPSKGCFADCWRRPACLSMNICACHAFVKQITGLSALYRYICVAMVV